MVPIGGIACRKVQRVAYVAHGQGVLRIDLRARSVAPLTAPQSVSIDRVERMRWRARGLIAIQVAGDGSRSIVRLDLNPSGRAVTRATTLERPASTTKPISMTFSGEDLVYRAEAASDSGGASGEPSRAGEIVAYRLRLR